MSATTLYTCPSCGCRFTGAAASHSTRLTPVAIAFCGGCKALYNKSFAHRPVPRPELDYIPQPESLIIDHVEMLAEDPARIVLI